MILNLTPIQEKHWIKTVKKTEITILSNSAARTNASASNLNNKITSSSEGLIGSDKEIEAALAVVSGTVEGFELENDKGASYYEIEIKEGRSEHEVDVNAQDGSILKVESDADNDDDDDRE